MIFFVLLFDLAECNFPLLISRRPLFDMSDIPDSPIESAADRAHEIPDRSIHRGTSVSVTPTDGARVIQSIIPDGVFSQDEAFTESLTNDELPLSDVLRLHLQLGRAPYAALLHLRKRCSMGGAPDQMIAGALKSGACRRVEYRAPRPRRAKFISEYPSRAAFMDICYTVNREREYHA